jgi:hypothetical protein
MSDLCVIEARDLPLSGIPDFFRRQDLGFGGSGPTNRGGGKSGVIPCSVREELEQRITKAQEEIGQSQYDSPKSSSRAKAKLNRLVILAVRLLLLNDHWARLDQLRMISLSPCRPLDSRG